MSGGKTGNQLARLCFPHFFQKHWNHDAQPVSLLWYTGMGLGGWGAGGVNEHACLLNRVFFQVHMLIRQRVFQCLRHKNTSGVSDITRRMMGGLWGQTSYRMFRNLCFVIGRCTEPPIPGIGHFSICRSKFTDKSKPPAVLRVSLERSNRKRRHAEVQTKTVRGTFSGETPPVQS